MSEAKFDSLGSVKDLKTHFPIHPFIMLTWPIYATGLLWFFSNDSVLRQVVSIEFLVVTLHWMATMLSYVGAIVSLFHLRGWLRVLPADELEALSVVELPEPGQQALAAAVLKRKGRLRLYDLAPVVYATIKHREKVKAELQARKDLGEPQSDNPRDQVTKAADTLHQRFMRTSKEG